MASNRKKITLRFNKNKSVTDNFKLLEQYTIKLDSTYGNILNKNLNEHVDKIREIIKNDVNDLRNEQLLSKRGLN